MPTIILGFSFIRDFCSSFLEGVLQRGFVSGNLKKIDPDNLGPDDPGSAVKFNCDGDQEIAVKRLLYFSIRLLSVGAVTLELLRTSAAVDFSVL